MLSKKQPIFLASLGLNLCLSAFFMVWLARKGGISYISNKLNPPPPEIYQTNSRPTNTYFSTSYRLRTNQFEILPNTENDIILLGDSLTHQGEWVELLGNAKVRNRGIGGDTTDGVLNRLDEVVTGKPRQIFLLIGTNDFWFEKKTVPELISNYQLILEKIQESSPQTEVVIQSLLPVNNSQFNRNKVDNQQIIALNKELEKLANQFNYPYIDLHTAFVNENNELKLEYTYDGVHLNGQGYLVWTEIIKPYID